MFQFTNRISTGYGPHREDNRNCAIQWRKLSKLEISRREAGCLKTICEREEAGDGAGDGVLSEEFHKLDLKAQDIITSLISDDFLEYVRDQTTAKGMWDSLCATFERRSCQGQTLVRKELANLKLLEGGNLNAHLIKFDNLVRQLKAAGAKPSEGDLISQLFITLPASYDAVVTALENLAEEDLKLSTVKSRLLGEETKQNNRNADQQTNSTNAASSDINKPIADQR